MDIIKSIIDRIQNAEVQDEPFNHLVIDDLLPADFYTSLAR